MLNTQKEKNICKVLLFVDFSGETNFYSKVQFEILVKFYFFIRVTPEDHYNAVQGKGVHGY